MVAGKTMMALTPKAESGYSVEEAAAVAQFRELRQLQLRLVEGLTPDEEARYEELRDRERRGELRGLISYTDPLAIGLCGGVRWRHKAWPGVEEAHRGGGHRPDGSNLQA